MRHASLILLFLIALWGNSQSQFIENEPAHFRRFTREQGLSGNQITALLQDSQGFLWIGTSEGLNRFDGKDFQHFHHDVQNPEQSLSGNSIRGIYEYDSKIFISTHRGVSVFDLHLQGFTNTILPDERFNYKSLHSINYMVHEGDYYYVGGEKTLLRLNEKFEVVQDINEEISNKNNSQHRDFIKPIKLNNSTLLFPNCGKGVVFDLTNFSVESAHPEDHPSSFSILSFCQTAAFTLMDTELQIIASWGMDPILINQNTIVGEIPLKKTLGLEVVSTTDIYRVEEQKLWIATDIGLCEYHLETGTCRKINQKNERNGFRCILKDSDHSIWVGSETGLYQYRLSSGGFKMIELKDYNSSSTETNIHDFAISGDQLLMNLQSDEDMRIFLWKGNALQTLTKTSNPAGIRSISPIGDDTLLIGYWDGMSLYSMKEKREIPNNILPPQLEHKIVLGAIKDYQNQLWIALGANSGIYRYDLQTKTGHHYTYESTGIYHLPIASAYDLTLNKDGNLYLVRGKIDGKLVRWNYKNQVFEIIKPSSQTSARFEGESYCVDIDIHQNIWFGVVREGLFCYNPFEKTIKHFDTNSGLLSNNIFALECDKYGNVWLGTSSGIEVLRAHNETFIHFTQSDGLPVSSFEPVSTYFHDTLFFSSGGKLIYFEPSDILDRTPKPKTYIYQISINDQIIDKSINDFRYNQNFFEFSFTAVDLTYGKDFLYRYKINGLEDSWHYGGTLKSAVYANLSPGNYEFEVSVLVDGKWQDGLAKYAFTVRKPYWLTWWFIALCIILLGLIVYVIIRFRINRVREIEGMRSKISRDLHDDIGSGLSSIRILSSNTKTSGNDKALESLKKIQMRSQNMLDKMDDIIWAINPSEDKGSTLFIRMREHASEMTEAAGMNLEIKLDPGLENVHFSMDQKSNLFLIFKEGINNAIKYSDSSNIEIEFHKKGTKGILSIRDNGRGFDVSNPNQGNGLKNMKDRAHELKGLLTLESTPGKGTHIHLVFDL